MQCDNNRNKSVFSSVIFFFFFFIFRFTRSMTDCSLSVDGSQWDSLFSENFGSRVVRTVDWLNRISDENQQTNLLGMPERSFG